MSLLITKTNKVCIVVRKNVPIDLSALNSWLHTYTEFFAWIKHEGDISPQGVEEGIHYHIVARLKERKRLSTTLYSITEALGFSNSIGLEIDRYNSLEGSLQYLIHKNDLDKTPHKIEEITHNFDKEEFKTLMESENDCLTFDRLLFICRTAKCKSDIMKSIGLGYYQHYRNCISDILDDLLNGRL